MAEILETSANVGKKGTLRGLASGILFDLLGADPLAGLLYKFVGLSAVVWGTSLALQHSLAVK